MERSRIFTRSRVAYAHRSIYQINMHWFLIFIFIVCSTCGASSRPERVESLPGFQGPLPFYLETGYVGVDVNEDVQLFYYFVKSESDPENDPLMVWLTGGPGCSAITGLVYEIGPIQFQFVPYNGTLPTLILNPNSWSKMASIIFVDIPVGAGFSYGRTTFSSHSTDVQLCKQVYEFIRKWFKLHPELKSNQLYIGGDSYSGIPVPIITQLISDGNESGIEPSINLKGYILGNPQTYPTEKNHQVRFANGMGLISDEIYKALFHSCQGEYRSDYIDPSNIDCLQNLKLFQECTDVIEFQMVLDPKCGGIFSPIQLPSIHLPISFECHIARYTLVYYWLNDNSVREALHIRKGTTGEWIRCISSTNLNFTKTILDTRPYHLNLSQKGNYRSLIYSGDHDMEIPHYSTEAWIKELKYVVMDQWRSWKLQGQIAGYTERYSNMMTYATVKGGGHVAPEYKPEACFAMFKRWISNQPL